MHISWCILLPHLKKPEGTGSENYQETASMALSKKRAPKPEPLLKDDDSLLLDQFHAFHLTVAIAVTDNIEAWFY
jgi:hypothetical protein